MPENAQPPELLAALEEVLVRQRPFADSDYIREQLEVCYRRRLGKIAARFPVAAELERAIGAADAATRYRVIGDPALRCAIQHAHAQIETEEGVGLPLAECARLFEAALGVIGATPPGTLPLNRAGGLERVGAEPHHGWIWSEDHPDDVFGRSFRQVVRLNYGDPVSTLDAAEVAGLKRGERLLAELLPQVAASALGHAHLVAGFADQGFWTGKSSSSQFRIGGAIFLSRAYLTSPWWVAEHLLHESLHHKLYDFRHGHTLLDPDFSREGATRVVSLWNPQELSNANLWDAHRAFAAFHVYVHLGLLALTAERRARELEDRYGPKRDMVSSRTALDRAHYLGGQLRTTCWRELGLAGRQMAEWLMSVLGYLDPAPPPEGASMHLALDLYQREANAVDRTLRQWGEVRRSRPMEQLAVLAGTEIEAARGILSGLEDRQGLDHLDAELGRHDGPRPAAAYPEVRRAITAALQRSSPDGYRLVSRSSGPGGPEDPDQLVRRMVEQASRDLYLTLLNLPPTVFAARQRARDQRFRMFSDEGVGRLLASLAAALAPRARVLEIGAGVGVGTAWIVHGLRARTDVEVVAVEIDPELSRSLQSWAWPSYVQTIPADVCGMLPALGGFDLIFADASPVKYGPAMEAVVEALQPRGQLLVDDMRAPPGLDPEKLAEKNTLRRFLLHHPELQALELDWATGLILATRCAGPPAAAYDPAAARRETVPAALQAEAP